MKQRFILFRRAGVFYCEDTTTRKQTSLRTKDERQALTLLNTKNEAARQPAMNLQIAQVYLQYIDPAASARTRQHVMEQILSAKTGNTRERWEYASRDGAFDLIRQHKLIETTSEQFLQVLKKGSVSTNVYLRRAHNFAIGMGWLPRPVLPTRLWPAVQYKDKRAITLEERRLMLWAWPMIELSIDQLKRAVHLKEQIENLQAELTQVLDGSSPRITKSRSTATGARRGAARRTRRTDRSGEAVSAAKTARRRMSAAGRARMAAAARARWKKAKASGKNSLAG